MKQTTSFNCPVEATLSLIGGKYKPLILWHLINHPLHYMELQRLIPSATPKNAFSAASGSGKLWDASQRGHSRKATENSLLLNCFWRKYYSCFGVDV